MRYTLAQRRGSPFPRQGYCLNLLPHSEQLLSESGFDDFPFMVPRFVKDSVSTYGRSPAMNALPDVKMLNKMSETTIRAAQKQIDPPLMVPDDGFVLPVRTTPGALNFYRSGTRDRLEPLNIGAYNPLGLNMEEQRRMLFAKLSTLTSFNVFWPCNDRD